MAERPSNDAPTVVLVIDDEPKNVQVVGALLLKHGHEVIAAGSGPEALAKLDFVKPDLILLDVMMPGMTGFELCRILRSKPATCETPIIFLSASADKDAVVEGLSHGGVDYVTKPFHGPELISRIELHSNLRKTRKRLDDLIREQTRLLEIVAHDLKNPLSGIQIATTMLAGRSLETRDEALVSSIRDCSNRAFQIISSLLQTSELDAVKAAIRNRPICLRESASLALRNFDQHIHSKSLSFSIQSPATSLMVTAEERSLICCLENLISNAIKFSPKGARVVIDIVLDHTHGEFRISDEGPGIQDEELDQLFKKFTRLTAQPTGGEASTGLGLHIVHELVHAMHGSIQYRRSTLGGACFSLKLPLVKSA